MCVCVCMYVMCVCVCVEVCVCVSKVFEYFIKMCVFVLLVIVFMHF